MGQTKIYPSTQAQVQAVQNTVNEINSKIVTPSYEVKVENPSNIQKTVTPSPGYTAAAVYGDLSGTIGANAFQNCTSLQSIDARNVILIGSGAFQSCASLQSVDARNVTSISSSAFQSCASLQLIDCTSCTTPPTIYISTFNNTNNSFMVVVATDTEKALFQAATNWSAIASRIYTVAEIEALVGMTYDEYYLQCFGHPRNEVQA